MLSFVGEVPEKSAKPTYYFTSNSRENVSLSFLFLSCICERYVANATAASWNGLRKISYQRYCTTTLYDQLLAQWVKAKSFLWQRLCPGHRIEVAVSSNLPAALLLSLLLSVWMFLLQFRKTHKKLEFEWLQNKPALSLYLPSKSSHSLFITLHWFLESQLVLWHPQGNDCCSVGFHYAHFVVEAENKGLRGAYRAAVHCRSGTENTMDEELLPPSKAFLLLWAGQ